jgi:hypothetical protein
LQTRAADAGARGHPTQTSYLTVAAVSRIFPTPLGVVVSTDEAYPWESDEVLDSGNGLRILAVSLYP